MNCGRSSSVERKLPKLQRRVRFPSPAPLPAWPSAGRFCYASSLRERQFPRSIACTCEYAAYRPVCVGFWAVFRCYKAERWGCGPTPGTAHLRGGAMPEPICSKQSPPRPQHPIFGIFRRGVLQFEHSVRRTHRQTGELTTIDPRHAGDTPTETFYGSNSPHQARDVGGRLGHHVGIRAPTAEAPCQSPSAQSVVHLAHNTPFSAFFAEVFCSLSTASGAPTAKRGNLLP